VAANDGGMYSSGVRVTHQELLNSILVALAGAGVPENVRHIEAEIMAEADLLGTPSHGVRMLPGLLRAIRDGRINASPKVKLKREFAATCVLDGDHGVGRFVSVQATNCAIERARQFGIGACLATNTGHWGRAHAYAYRTAQARLIGICTTNALPSILAFGSQSPVLGNNPLAIGVPRGDAGDPIVLDMAMSQAAVGKVETYRRSRQSAPPGWGLNAQGETTDDPAAILASGKFLPMGNHKGAGLALMLEMLTAVLAGGVLCYEMGQSDASGADADSTKLFLALNPEAFGERTVFEDRMRDLTSYLQAAVETDNGSVLRLPGQNGWELRDKHLRDGIPIDSQTVSELQTVNVHLKPVTQ